ncbi:MAG: flagellar biosynthetic protein FliO [Balneolales bacterium]|nr:flagellar biosynthetic protein FliO [Balneolales bacterium]
MDLGKLISHSSGKPKNVLQIVLSVSVVLLVFWLFMVSRMELSTSNSLVESEARIDSVQSVRSTLLNEESTIETTETTAEQETSPIFQNALTTFIVMIGMLGLVWWLSRRKASATAPQSEVKEIDQFVLGQGAQLKFIEVNGEIWVLGVSPQVLNLLHRIPKEEWKKEENNRSEQIDVEQKTDFKSIYKLLGN